jgi:hypothetical protein
MTIHIHEGFKFHPILQWVPWKLADQNQWPFLSRYYVEQGYEGIIIRHPKAYYTEGKSSNILKYKLSKTYPFRIVGYFEAISKDGDPKDMLGGLQVVDSKGLVFKTGAGRLTHGERVSLWHGRDNLIGKIAIVKYPCLSDRGVPLEPILMGVKNGAKTK